MKRFLRFLILFVGFIAVTSVRSFAQTTLVDPTGAGGFELGVDMSANGWTTVNAATDGWFVGNVPVSATGTNCGYVSAGGGTTWTYSQTNTFTHIYRDITIPANESKVTLTFKWKAGGEGATFDWDNMKIFLAPTSVTPTTAAAVTGATQLSGPGSTGGMYKLNSAAWNNETIVFAGVPGTTYRLIFSWKSDSGTIANPPAALDDVSVVSNVAGTFISIVTGNWNNPATWDANAVPSAADNATVSATHTVTINATGQAINNLIVNGTLAYATTPTQFNVNGNLTVNNGGLVNAFNGTTGKTLFVTGNIVNNGTLNFSVGGTATSQTGASVLNLNGSSVQTINGTGTFLNNKIGSLVCSNTSTATPNINWQFDNIIVQHTLNLSNARFNLGTLTMSHGSSFNTNTASMTLTTTDGCGFMPGAKYRRWYTTAATGTTVSAGIDPSTTSSRFPFINAAGTNQRWVHINRSSSTTTGNTAGYLAVVYNDATTMTTGLSVLDGTYTVTDRYDGNWTISAEGGYVYASGFHRLAISANGAYPPLNGNTRIMLANAPMLGNHQNGTVTPTGQRIDLSTAQLTAGTLYLGIASADNQYPCAGAPNIPEALATTAASVCPNGTVTMNATGLTTGFIGITNQWQVSSVSGGPYTNVLGGTGATTATHTTAAIATPGTYYFVLASTCLNTGQTSNSNELVITVNPLPVITITPSNNGYFCGAPGQTQTLTASGASTYAWSPSASLDAATGTTVTSNVSTPTTYTVTGTDANGCINTKQITVGPPAITATSSVANFCGTGGSAALNAVSAADPDMAYTWLPLTPSATLSASTGSTTSATLTETSDFKVTGTGSGSFAGCTSEAFVSVGVYPLPSATVTTTASGVCPGTPATINSGLSAGNFASSCITAPTGLSSPPANATTLILNGVSQTLPSGVSWSSSLDDGKFGPVPIGFDFNFFGSNQTTLNIGTNGVVNFGPYANFDGGQYIFTGGFPNNANPANTIAVCARDMRFGTPAGYGTLRYWVEGYAPNRRFIVQYENVPVWSGVVTTPTPSGFNNAEVVFYETLGNIDIRVISATNGSNVPNLTTPSAQANLNINKYIGLQDGTKTIGATAPNCATNAANYWNGQSAEITTPQAWRFTPPSNYNTIWTATDANGTTTIASGNNIFSQSVSPTNTTTYAISYTNQTTGCTNAAGSAQVVMSVLGNTAPIEVSALTNTPNVCIGQNLSLTTDYTGSQDGLTYQWQVSTDNGNNYTNIQNATNITYSGTQTQSSVYRLEIKACNGEPSYTIPVSVGMTPFQDCYCIPTSSCSSGDVIASISLNTLSNNTGTACSPNGYTNFTTNSNLTTTLLPSTTYTCVVGVADYAQSVAVWIDYNDDGIFDNNTERIGFTTSPIPVNGTASFNVVLGCNPSVGPHRMRVRSSDNNFVTGINQEPCTTYSWGETEDYLITIAPVPTCPAPGQLSVVTTTTTSADLSWNLGCSSASNFDFEYGPVGFTLGTGTSVSNVAATINAGVGTYTLTGLVPNTAYSIYYRANCGNNDLSSWSVAADGTTNCNPITLNNPSNQTVCDSYTLPAITETTPSGNAGLVLEYRTQPNGGGTVITSSTITSSQTVYIYASAGSCTAEQSFVVTVNQTPLVVGGATNSSLCLGDSTNFSLTAGTSATFTFVENGNTIGSTSNPLSFYVTPAASTVIGVYSTANGCSSQTLNITLTVNSPSSSSVTQTACNAYQWNGQTYTSSGVYTYTTQNAVGCDSVVTLNLTVNQSPIVVGGAANSTLCLGDSTNFGITAGTSATFTFVENGNTIGSTSNPSGFYVTPTSSTVIGVYSTANGCSSDTLDIAITVNSPSSSSVSQTACDLYQWNGQTYTSSGVYTFTTQNAAGCDSVVTLNLIITDNVVDVTDISVCSSYTWNGQTYTQSGTYTFTGTGNCAVTDTLHLTILNNSGVDVQTACETFTWIDGNTYTSSTNTPTFTLTNVAGCDSLVTLNLTINNSTTSSTSQTACGSYTWNGQTYTQSGSYTFAATNQAGCDSVATLILTINAFPNALATVNEATLTSSSGSSYQWINCNTNLSIQGATSQTYTATENGTYAVIVTNSAGCSDTSECVVVDKIGMEEISKFEVNVNPNPSTGIFIIDFETALDSKLTVLDASGRVIFNSSISDDTTIDLSFAVTGVYYIQLSADEFNKTIRVVKN